MISKRFRGRAFETKVVSWALAIGTTVALGFICIRAVDAAPVGDPADHPIERLYDNQFGNCVHGSQWDENRGGQPATITGDEHDIMVKPADRGATVLRLRAVSGKLFALDADTIGVLNGKRHCGVEQLPVPTPVG